MQSSIVVGLKTFGHRIHSYYAQQMQNTERNIDFVFTHLYNQTHSKLRIIEEHISHLTTNGKRHKL